MALRVINIAPLDPNGFTGPTRMMAGIARMGDIVLDSPYGEFARWIYLGHSGDVSIVKWDGTTQVLVGLAAGTWHPIYSLQVNSASTTATSMIWGS